MEGQNSKPEHRASQNNRELPLLATTDILQVLIGDRLVVAAIPDSTILYMNIHSYSPQSLSLP